MPEELRLNKANRLQIARAFNHVPRVDMSIDCVTEGQMGKAIVDDARKPTVFKLEVGPFFYFAGDVETPGGQELLGSILPYTLFMPSAPGWIEVAKDRFGKQLVSLERWSFSSEHLSLAHLTELIEQSDLRSAVRRINVRFARRLWGQEHFVDLSDFDSPADFVRRGAGFYMEAHGQITGAAYTSLACSRGIEVSLFVDENYRRRGIATVLSACLLKWCLEQNTHPNWDAANPESCSLAEKLGYKPLGSYQAYYLKD